MSSPYFSEEPSMLKQGAKGHEVERLQQQLNAVGCICKVDGIFGKETRQAVINFQNGFGLDADGIVGPKTLSRLEEQARQSPNA